MYKTIKKAVGNNILWICISIIVIFIDRITKFLVIEYLPFRQSVAVLQGFNLLFTTNKGAAFSLLNYETTKWQIWLFGIIALVVSGVLVVWLVRLAHTKLWQRIALALVLGGALSNLIDRVLYHHVVDFIDLYVKDWHWPAFNIADTAICIGAIMLIIESNRAQQ